MDEKTKTLIQTLAQQYETAAFLTADPSQFMHRYTDARDAETAAFIAANLAFGRREQILSHTERILAAAGNSPAEWILREEYRRFFVNGNSSFYRIFSDTDMLLFCDSLRRFLRESTDGTLGGFFRPRFFSESTAHYHTVIARAFPADCRLVPHTADSASKRLNMLLRWLVRRRSAVDLGLWDFLSSERLLMPLDTHVMHQSTELGFFERTRTGKIRQATLKAAVQLTEAMREIFPDDPVRADFALFGLGVNKA